ncbi:hypothetical protein [Methylobacterium durans]|uniref:Uncharacterized protein n=1 Tax=Methylobacterium durans TaxID=2202825 RepID=A0A2U8WCD7_9HYPH|nr:hypothetical protein [Methylobacterium durans]AWN43719.1 hypothetical protein DK389_28410 [Methylobacterium durans]
MISGVPLTAIGLLRQADLELTARNSQLRRGEAPRESVTVELVQSLDPPRRGNDAAPTSAPVRRRLVDIFV